MKKLKKVIPIITAFIIGISTTVTAATVFNSKDITYSSDKTEVTNVKDSLDELYSKVGKCPDGWYCHTVPTTIADNVELGDYIKMTPTSTSYTISKDLTGYDKDQTINPSELNIWRVIKKNDDGTIDAVSEYVSDKMVIFYGKIGYMNFVGVLNLIASQYSNSIYVSKTRHIGYEQESEFCVNDSIDDCPGRNYVDTNTELNMLKEVEGLVTAKSKEGSVPTYYFASRNRSGEDGMNLGSFCYYNHLGYASGCGGLRLDGEDKASSSRVRPIITLKSNVMIKSGEGKSTETAYTLE